LTEAEKKTLPPETPRAEEDEDDEDDRRAVNSAQNDIDREAIRERRRQEKVDRKERRDKAIARDKIELDYLRKQNDELERRLSGVEHRAFKQDLASVEGQLKGAINEVEMAEQVISKAIAAGNGDDVTKAMRFRDEAMEKARRLNAIRERAGKPDQPQTKPTKPAAPQLDPVTMDHARKFMEEHDWYDPAGKDEASSVVLAVDAALNREGIDQKSDTYWTELRNRIKKRLPEKFASRPSRGGPNVGSGREHAPTSTRREVYISPERKAALIEAGVWDDPALRQRYVRKYMEYDRNNRS
jgi:hypothetical protein